jgi:RNA polymerase sigma factor (sigma-70 family)
MEKNLTRISLIQKLQEDRNDESWNEFIDLYEGYIFTIAKKMNFCDDDCYDIMQTAFVKIWSKVSSFEHGGNAGQFRRWLAVITRNSGLNHIDKRKREQAKHDKYYDDQANYLNTVTEPEIEKMAEKEWAIYVTNLAWKNVQDDISQTQKDIFEMTLDGKSRTEIAEALEIPLNTVSVYKRRVTAILQKEIKRLEKTAH